MNTKEAIEFLRTEKRIECGRATQCALAKDFDKVIELLEEAEELGQIKFEQMWEELREKYRKYPPNIEENNVIDKLEQKYFPIPEDKCDSCVYKKIVNALKIAWGDKEL